MMSVGRSRRGKKKKTEEKRRIERHRKSGGVEKIRAGI